MNEKIYCAIDTSDLKEARFLVGALSDVSGGMKLGLEFFNAHGAAGVKAVLEGYEEARLFLDLKYHDIPNTVAGAVKAASFQLKPAYINVHASGGREMMKAARQACFEGTRVLAVTVLTSLDDNALSEVGQACPASDQVRRLAALAAESGMDGVVCSAHEIEMLRRECGDDFILMVPGIRPAGADTGDQKRIMTPSEAVRAGASHLVIGRPITKAADPAEAARKILKEIEEAS